MTTPKTNVKLCTCSNQDVDIKTEIDRCILLGAETLRLREEFPNDKEFGAALSKIINDLNKK
jgi:hypothetical protein